jgi:glycosyltransferase involved in cell wall biosynthesis
MTVTVAMPVRDEAGRYLSEALEAAGRLADRIVVLDDGSEDDSADVARAAGAEVYQTPAPEPLFSREWRLRSLLWERATHPVPDWLVMLDADELLEGATRLDFEEADKAGFGWLAVPLYDLWDTRETYRDDGLWTAHRRLWPFAVRYRPGFPYEFPMADHHCGRWPRNAFDRLVGAACGGRILHLGWLREEDRRAKHERYMRLDPEGRWGSLEQYRSILDPNPRLSRLEPPPCAF